MITPLAQDTKRDVSQHHGTPTIGMLARLEFTKGGDVFLKALSWLAEQGTVFKAHIAGNGPEYNNLLTLAKNLKLNDKVDFLGWIDDKSNFFKNIDVLCVPSRSESFGLVMLESFIHHVPVIASDVSGPREIIDDRVDGILFPSEDYIKLGQNLQLVLSDHKFRLKLISNAVNKVKLYYSANVSRLLISLIEKLTAI